MKKFILNILIFLTILTININNCLSKESKDYVLASQMGNRYEVGYPRLDYVDGFEINTECPDTNSVFDCVSTYTPYYFTKSECLEKANKNIDLWKETEGEEREGYYYKVVDKYYAVSADVDNIYNVFCIPVKMWNKMKPAHKNSKTDTNIEKIYKTNESFAEVMKKCGFTAFDYDHINLHDTPFICDKYNKKNPIPYVSYDEILSKENKDYVLVNLSAVGYELGLPNADTEIEKDERKLFVYYYTKSECFKKANKKMQDWKDLRKNNLERPKYYYKMIDKYYVASADTNTIYNYFCIPIKIWNEIKPEFSKNDRIYSKGLDDIIKNIESFTEVMKKCGFTAFDYDHINLHDRPFICGKYNENNPIPYVSYDEILSKKK